MNRVFAILLCLALSGSVQARVPRGTAPPAGCPASPFVIQFVLDASVSLAPPTFMQSLNTAACMLTSTISSPITISVNVFFDNSGSGTSSGGPQNSSFQSYSTIRTALLGVQATADQAQFNSTLPAGTSLQGVNTFSLARAVGKAIGLVSARDISVLDGTLTIGSGVLLNSLIGVGLHEITHVMGRVGDGSATFQWTTFTAVGTRNLAASAVANYFSIDNGVTNLASVDVGTDPGDWGGSNTPADDVFNAVFNPSVPYTQSLTALDKQLLNVMGFKIP